MDKDYYYQTSDIALATTISLFNPLEKIQSQTNDKSLFLFKRSEQLEELINKYWAGTLRVEPKNYFNQLKTIKTRLYSEK